MPVIRCITALIGCGVVGVLLAGLIAWLWLATVDGSEHFGW